VSEAAEIHGYVEVMTPTQVLGWAWAPRTPDRRVTVQAVLGDAVVAEAPADREREDLAGNGIGDGRHAFELKLPDTARSRLQELRVVGRTASGGTIPLGVPPSAESVEDRLNRLQRGVDALVASQRVLHRNLQAALTAPRPGEGASDITSVQEQLGKQMATLELFAMRIEERLALPTTLPAPQFSRAGLITFAMVAAVLAFAVMGLWRELAP
jgi:hypothetical protein